jgi:hypothetical protein
MTARPTRHTRSAGAKALLALLALVVALSALGAAAAAAADPASAATSEDYFFLSSIGPEYAAGLSFATGGAGPYGIATDSAGNIYVTLPLGFAKFDSAGTHIVTYTGDNGYTAGNCYGLDVDWRGNVFLADRTNHLIAKVHPTANGVNGTSYSWVSQTGKNAGLGDANIGTAEGEFNFPADVAVGGNYLYVADMLNNRIQKFYINPDTNQLDFDSAWGKAGGASGTADGEFNKPRAVDVQPGAGGHVFVCEETGRRVQELTSTGGFVSKFGPTAAADPLYLMGPTGLDVDAQGDVCLTDFDGARAWIGKFRSSGGVWSRVTRIGAYGTADGQFMYPWNCVADASGCLWVAESGNRKLIRVARDTTAPTITPLGFPTGWTKTIGHPEFTAVDPAVAGQYTSGGVSIWYSVTGLAPWYRYLEPLASSEFAEGDNAVTYYAKDAVGNESTPAVVHVLYDKTAPRSSISGLVGGWTKDLGWLGISATDALCGIVKTEWSGDGGVTWHSSAISGLPEGSSTILHRATDAAGNVEEPQSAVIGYDKTRPVPQALASKTVKRLRTVRLPFKVRDVPGAKARVTIKLFKGSTLKKTLAVGTKAANASLTYGYRCKLPRGKYTWKVYATDLAGNTQAKPGVKYLTVK